MSIKNNSYFAGAVQSLGFIGKSGVSEHVDMTVGVIEPGSYDFGPAERCEIIHVTSGHLIINGTKYGRGWHVDDTCTIQSGVPIQIVAEETASYICWYDGLPG